MDFQKESAQSSSQTGSQAAAQGENNDAATSRMEELLAMVCHELRSPLASIRYSVRLFLGTHPRETARRQQLQILIERQTRQMTRLLDDLLDVSRMRNNLLQLQRERLDLRTTVGHAIDTLASEMEACGHQLTMSAPPGPVWVTGDPVRLEQVFINLLANAAKYTEHGGQLSVRIHLQGNEAFVGIRDSGIGIAPQLLPHIFDLFRQADASVPQARSGLGIGLAIVRNLVELHGGTVTASSRGLGHGSEFIVCLPAPG